MDPVSAVGIASAAIQFLDASAKVIATCKEIRDDAKSATRRNKEIEETTRTLRDVRKEFESSAQTQCKISNQVPKRVYEAVAKCAATSDELLNLLELVRGASGKPNSVMVATFRALKERKTIEKLENTLRERQKLLDQVILQNISTRLHSHAIEQARGLADLRTSQHSVQKLVVRVIEQQVNNDQKAQQRLDEVENDRRKQKFQDSLFFDDLDLRRNQIKSPAFETANWIFDMQHQHKWADFTHWLGSKRHIYWISGKPGSGKSTLMAHIADDRRTVQGLRKWSRLRRLHVLSFYFWRAGSSLQNSILGLLKSLLYQICEAHPPAIQNIIARLSMNPDRIQTWTVKNLNSAVHTAFAAAKDSSFCLFIDGLDEYTEDYDELLDLVFDLQRYDNVKCCVSSRPEVQISSRMIGVDQLRVQDLNYNDIFSFVAQKLHRLESLNRDRYRIFFFTRTIVDKAEGVFLWASVVAGDIAQGAKRGDDYRLLSERLASAPDSLHGLFKSMLERVDKVHRASLAFYLQCMMFYSRAPRDETEQQRLPTLSSIAVLTAARMEGPFRSYESFEEECQRTETQVMAQSAGLLEVDDWYNEDDDMRGTPELCEWNWNFGNDRFLGYYKENPTDDADSGCAIGHDLFAMNVHRERCDATCTRAVTPPYPKVLRYERRGVQWVHRSAYDFVLDSIGSSLWNLGKMDPLSVRRQLWRGALRYLKVAPSWDANPFDNKRAFLPPYRRERSTQTLRRVAEIMESALASYKEDCAGAFTILDDLRHVLSGIDSLEVPKAIRVKFCPEKAIPGVMAFWGESAWTGCWEYILSRRAVLLQEPVDDLFFASFLAQYMSLVNQCETEPVVPFIYELLDRLLRSMDPRSNRPITPDGQATFLFRHDKRSTLDWEHYAGIFCMNESHHENGDNNFDQLTTLAIVEAYSNWLAYLYRATDWDEGLSGVYDLAKHDTTELSNQFECLLQRSDTYMALRFASTLRDRWNDNKPLALLFSPMLWLSICSLIGIRSGGKIVENQVLLELFEANSESVFLGIVSTDAHIKRDHFAECHYGYPSKASLIKLQPATVEFITSLLAVDARFERTEDLDRIELYLCGQTNEIDKCRELVMQDIWENKANLNATDQLFALAYVRKYLLALSPMPSMLNTWGSPEVAKLGAKELLLELDDQFPEYAIPQGRTGLVSFVDEVAKDPSLALVDSRMAKPSPETKSLVNHALVHPTPPEMHLTLKR